MYFRLHTLGCKVNQYETALVREGLLNLGYLEAGKDDIADIVIINTCTVTAESDLKSRKLLRKLIKENRGAAVAVMGCSVVKQPEVYKNIEGLTEIITDKQRCSPFFQRIGLTELPRTIGSFGERHRAYVKIQDGCVNGCSYCIIPKVRPHLQSRNEDEVLDEIQQLAANGYREIVLTGIHLGFYGKDFREASSSLTSLLKRCVALDEPFRIRLSSLEAVEVSDELVELMLQNPKRICSHLHLSMQSGSDSVLRRMKRRWGAERFVQRCQELQRYFDRLALTTDIIVGFPGETEEEFEETCEAVRTLKFSKVHIFRYSPREGTAAAALPNPVSPQIQRRRAEYLLSLAHELRCEFARTLCGRTLSVLLESENGGIAERYLEVRLTHPVEPSQVGQLVNVRAAESQGEILVGEW